MIDLHVHTTASDGTCTPQDLVERARSAGIRTLAVADHDTVDAVAETTRRAAACGLTCVTGVEITAVHKGRDVHVLGYYVDIASPALLAFLAHGREDRRRRATRICERLADLGVPVDRERLLGAAGPRTGRALARPAIARALVEAGHVATIEEAFARFLAVGGPAYCPRLGASPADVVRVIADAGGIASIAHPGPLAQDALIEHLAGDGLGAIECFHSDHDEATTARYLEMARRLALAVTGGSDFHGPGHRREASFGRVGLPREHFDALAARAGVPVPAPTAAGPA